MIEKEIRSENYRRNFIQRKNEWEWIGWMKEYNNDTFKSVIMKG